MVRISQEKLKALPTDKLKFVLGVGQAGLKEWKKGPETADVKQYLAAIEAELALREQEART